MLTMEVLRRCLFMMLLLINLLLTEEVFTYQVFLNITTDSNSEIIDMGNSDSDSWDDFVKCICSTTRKTCEIPSTLVNNSPEPTSQTLPVESAADYASQVHFQCKYQYKDGNWRRKNEEVVCTRQPPSNPSDICTLNIIITCPDKSVVVLAWDETQNMNVLSFTDVQVIDCFKTTTTTTEVATTRTSTTSTSFTSTQQATQPSLSTLTDDNIITNINILESTSPMAGDTTINNTNLVNPNHLKGINDADFQISGPYIGIIVGAVVAAILITIAIMCIYWKLKTRREKNRRNEERESAMPATRNLEDTHVDRLRLTAKETDKKVSKTVAHVSPLERESHLTQVAADYTYIDVRSAASSKTNTTLASPFPVAEELFQNSTANAVSEIQNTEYSHFGTDKVRIENPYNGLEHEDSSTLIQPVILSVLQRDNQPLKHYLQAPHIRPTNNHISHGTKQSIGTSENNSLYSKLGESKGLPDNTYNLLDRANNEPITDTHFKQHAGTTSPNSETRVEIAPSSSETLQLFPHTLKYENMDIVDVAPYKYTEIIPTTKQEKSNDINQLNEANHQVSLSASSNDHAISPKAKSDVSTESTVAKEAVKDNKKNPTADEGSGQVYENALYSMHDFSNEENTGVSLEDTTYANAV